MLEADEQLARMRTTFELQFYGSGGVLVECLLNDIPRQFEVPLEELQATLEKAQGGRASRRGQISVLCVDDRYNSAEAFVLENFAVFSNSVCTKKVDLIPFTFRF